MFRLVHEYIENTAVFHDCMMKDHDLTLFPGTFSTTKPIVI